MNLRKRIEQSIAIELQAAVESQKYRKYSGEYCERLVQALTALLHGAQPLLFASGSAAIETTLRAVGIGPGCHVMLAAYDYPGNFWAIERTGARPLLIDAQPESWCLDVERLCKTIETSSSRPRAVIASHLHGQLSDISAMRELCDKHGILLVEDACQALGAQLSTLPVSDLAAQPTNADLAGHVTVCSFGGGKVISAGRGGACATQDARLAQQIKIAAGSGSGPYSLSELQAACVLGQLEYLDEINATTQRYFVQLGKLLSKQWIAPWSKLESNRLAFYQAGLLLRNASNKEHIIAAEQKLAARGVALGRGFVGFHKRSNRRCDVAEPLENTGTLVEQTITLHHSIAMDGEIEADELARLLG